MHSKINNSQKELISKNKKVLKKKSLIKEQDSCKKKIFKKINKSMLVYCLLFLIDIILIIYFAKRNKVNYVEVIGKQIFVSKTRYLLVGRNYITLVVTFFFYVYTLVVQRFFFKRNITKKYMVYLFFCYLVLNLVLFFIFTKRIY